MRAGTDLSCGINWPPDLPCCRGNMGQAGSLCGGTSRTPRGRRSGAGPATRFGDGHELCARLAAEPSSPAAMAVRRGTTARLPLPWPNAARTASQHRTCRPRRQLVGSARCSACPRRTSRRPRRSRTRRSAGAPRPRAEPLSRCARTIGTDTAGRRESRRRSCRQAPEVPAAAAHARRGPHEPDQAPDGVPGTPTMRATRRPCLLDRGRARQPELEVEGRMNDSFLAPFPAQVCTEHDGRSRQRTLPSPICTADNTPMLHLQHRPLPTVAATGPTP